MTLTRLSGPVRFALSAACIAALLASCKSKDSADDELEGDSDGSVSAGTGGDDNGNGGSLDGGLSGSDGGLRRDGGGFGRDAAVRPVQECPATVPQNGSSCVSGRGDCMIGDTFCDCPSDTSAWVCWRPADCPTTAPAEQSACGVVGMECEISGPDGGRGGLDCECTASGWDCGRQVCPASEPAGGGACEGGDGTCGFSNGSRICDCRSRQWVCWNMSDCPATSPTEATACPVQRMVCDYPTGDCECTATGWDCAGMSRPRDGGTADAAGLGDASTSDASTSDASTSDASTSDASASGDV